MAGSADEYSAVLVTVGLAHLEASTIKLADVLLADGARAQAALVRQAYIKLLEELRSIARKTAFDAQKYIKDAEVKSRVRPDTHGGGGPRLGDFVGESHPLPGVEGAVGINYEPALYSNVPWWWTNEEGFSGLIGQSIHGFFFDAGFTSPSRPDSSQFRQHPLFVSGSQQEAEFSSVGFTGSGAGKEGGKGGKGIIENPIPERRFVRKGAAKAEVEWHARVRAAKARFLAACERASLAAPPHKGPARGGRRGPARRP